MSGTTNAVVKTRRQRADKQELRDEGRTIQVLTGSDSDPIGIRQIHESSDNRSCWTERWIERGTGSLEERTDRIVVGNDTDRGRAEEGKPIRSTDKVGFRQADDKRRKEQKSDESQTESDDSRR